jgi:hypothetical protein
MIRFHRSDIPDNPANRLKHVPNYKPIRKTPPAGVINLLQTSMYTHQYWPGSGHRQAAVTAIAVINSAMFEIK